MDGISEADKEAHYDLVPELRKLEDASQRYSAIVHRYLHDMARAIESVCEVISPTGTCVMICGDNLVVGMQPKPYSGLH